MKIIKLVELEKSHRKVQCPHGGFISYRFLLDKDKMGFTLTHTFIPKGKPQFWHYKNHLEACYCISGKAKLTYFIDDAKKVAVTYLIKPDTLYVLDNNDEHIFEALEDTRLICIFNPPLKGDETHGPDGSYSC